MRIPEHISAGSVIQTFRRYGFSVHQTSDDWLIIRFPYPSTRYGTLDVSEGYTFWADLQYWADEAGIDREQFEE